MRNVASDYELKPYFEAFWTKEKGLESKFFYTL